jgi:hypothetical protein
MAIMKDPDGDSYQSPVALPVNFLSFNLHPSTAIYQVTEYIHERLFNDHLWAHHGLDVPSKRWERLLSLFQFAREIGLLLRPRRNRIHEGAAEL